ncbi:MAG: bifunctional nuclease family protein [Planctomycetes bacterium]|nr:bifunctional nuclease family protein [Planctomycetota bacterium]
MELIKVKIRKVIGPTPNGAAILLGNDIKTFVVFVGFYEAAALIREMNKELPARPLTHELIQNVFLGFDVTVKQIIISSIIENTFCATLILQQELPRVEGQETVTRKEVRIDARPSDCLVLALKNKVDIYVSEEVFNQVKDVSTVTAEVESNLMGLSLSDVDLEMRGPEGSSGAHGVSDEDDEFDDDDDDLSSESEENSDEYEDEDDDR